jgi:hypothetical protein
MEPKMESQEREFQAVVQVDSGAVPNLRVVITANSLESARELLRAEYGGDSIVSLWSEEDAAKPR